MDTVEHAVFDIRGEKSPYLDIHFYPEDYGVGVTITARDRALTLRMDVEQLGKFIAELKARGVKEVAN